MKKKIVTEILSFMLILISLHSYGQHCNVKSISIGYVDLEIETPFRINCDTFDNFFKGEIRSFVVNDTAKIARIMEIIDQFVYEKDGKKPDVRQKMKVIKEGGEEIIICLDGGAAILLNGKPVMFNADFQKLVNDWIMNEEVE